MQTSHLPHPSVPAAADWLARLDRRLSASEQDAYFQWLRDDARHGRALVQIKHVWRKFDLLRAWNSVERAQPDPDLLAPISAERRRAVQRRTAGLAGLVAAGAIAGWLLARLG